jgi:hypothetical protein
MVNQGLQLVLSNPNKILKLASIKDLMTTHFFSLIPLSNTKIT